jgi:hypothetical protein
LKHFGINPDATLCAALNAVSASLIRLLLAMLNSMNLHINGPAIQDGSGNMNAPDAR